jgi:hypothetical protein
VGGRDRRHRLQTVGDRPVQLRGVDGVALGGSWPPASSTRPSSRVACDRYIVAWPSLGPAWYAGLGEAYRSISAVVATLPPAAMTLRPWLKGTKNDAPWSRRLVSSPLTAWNPPVSGDRNPTRTARPPKPTPVKRAAHQRSAACGRRWARSAGRRDAPGATGMVVDLRLGVERTRAVEAGEHRTRHRCRAV